MIRKFAGVIVGLLSLLLAATACATPQSTETASPGVAQGAKVVVETAPAPTAAAATVAPLPTNTKPAPAKEQPVETAPLAVEAPEKVVPAVQPQTVAEGAVAEPAGPTDEQQWVLDGLPSLGPAPELRNEVWLNSEPLRLADLRGNVVLLDMWTFG